MSLDAKNANEEVLLILNDPQSTVGTTEIWCRANKIKYKIVFAENLSKSPEGGPVKNLILFGGDMQVWETEKYPWLQNEKNWIKQTLTRGGRVFGICLGAQLLIEQLGGAVAPMPQWEVGWYPVNLLAADSNLTPLHWHQSLCKVPEDVTVTARDDISVQGFMTSPQVQGYQFHTEIDETRLAKALSSWKPDLKGKVQSAEQISSLASRYTEPLRKWYFTQLDSWWAKY